MSRKDNWASSWSINKIKDHDKISEISKISDNCMQIVHIEGMVYNITTISVSHISTDDLSEVVDVDTDFVLNIKNEPYIDKEVLDMSIDQHFGIGGLGGLMTALNQGVLSTFVPKEIDFILRGLNQHSRVSQVTRLDNRRFEVQRNGLEPVTIIALNDYDLTAEAVRSAISGFPPFEAIFTSNPNCRQSGTCGMAASSAGINIYSWGELLGALNRPWN